MHTSLPCFAMHISRTTSHSGHALWPSGGKASGLVSLSMASGRLHAAILREPVEAGDFLRLRKHSWNLLGSCDFLGGVT